MKTAFLFAAALFAALPAFGSEGSVGNGGDVVVCPNRVELLDYYEARTLRGMQADLGDGSMEDKVSTAFSRLSASNPSRAERYQGWFATFFQEANLLDGVDLVDVPDSQHVALPSGCAIQQIVIQNEPRFPEDKRYIVSKSLWDRLDSTNKAGLILHELIYREAIAGGVQNSIDVRYFNSLLASNRYADLSLLTRLTLEKRLGFSDTDVFGNRGLKLIRSNAEMCTSSDAVCFDDRMLTLKAHLLRRHIPFGGRDVEITTAEWSFETGHFSSFRATEPVSLTTPAGTFRTAPYSDISFRYPSASLWAAKLDRSAAFRVGSQFIRCQAGTEVRFRENTERLSRCVTEPGQRLVGSKVEVMTTVAGEALNFDESGEVEGIEYPRDGRTIIAKVLIEGLWRDVTHFLADPDEKEIAVKFAKEESFTVQGDKRRFKSSVDTWFSKGSDELKISRGSLVETESFVLRGVELKATARGSFGQIGAYPNGNLAWAYLETPSFDWQLAGQKVTVGGSYRCASTGTTVKYGAVVFHPSGELAEAVLVKSQDITLSDGNTHAGFAGDTITINAEGQIVTLTRSRCNP